MKWIDVMEVFSAFFFFTGCLQYILFFRKQVGNVATDKKCLLMCSIYHFKHWNGSPQFNLSWKKYLQIPPFLLKILHIIFICITPLKLFQVTCIDRNFRTASWAGRENCRGSNMRTSISPLRSTAPSAAAVVASWSFSTDSNCRNISVEIPLTWKH